MADTAKTTNYKKLIAMLKSKVEADFTAFAEHYDGNDKGFFKLLDGEHVDKVAFSTFPRSGNSMLRKQVELITGISTGASLSLNTATSLQIMGLAGEEIVDNRAFIIKAHHPFAYPGALEFDSTKVLMCVRNPLDCILSFASLINTMSHSADPEFSYATDFPEWWDWWVKDTAEQHAKFFKILIDACTTGGKNPVYITRFEDLLSDKQNELTGVMKFLLGLDDLTGTNAERRIRQVCDMPKESVQPYQLKKTTGKKDAHVDKYTKEQIEVIKSHNKEILYKFGYVNDPDPTKKNPTAFFDFGEKHDEKLAADFKGFRKINEESLKVVCSPDYKAKANYRINKEGCFVGISDPYKIQEPARQWAEKKLGYSKTEIKNLNPTEETKKY